MTDPDETYRSMGCAWGDYDRDGVGSAWAFLDENTMTAWVPAHAPGTVDVAITNPDGPTSRLLGLRHR